MDFSMNFQATKKKKLICNDSIMIKNWTEFYKHNFPKWTIKKELRHRGVYGCHNNPKYLIEKIKYKTQWLCKLDYKYNFVEKSIYLFFPKCAFISTTSFKNLNFSPQTWTNRPNQFKRISIVIPYPVLYVIL